MSYSLEDLLKASAETLGRGTVGSTYKVAMESGFIMTVKMLKDSRYPARVEEFRRHMEERRERREHEEIGWPEIGTRQEWRCRPGRFWGVGMCRGKGGEGIG